MCEGVRKDLEGGLNKWLFFFSKQSSTIMERQGYFYPGSFELKLLQSTRQGDFAFLNKDLIHYNQLITITQQLLWLTMHK